MTSVKTCPQCGCQLPADTPAGHCPDCLLGLGEDHSGPVAATPPISQETASSQRAGKFEPPSLAEMAKRFPDLDVIELLGQGGMGAVYKARQRKLDRFVAIKVLPPEVGANPEFADRFIREAQALARLNHPNIVAVHDFGDVDGLFYFVMEFVDGLNLRQSIATGRLAPDMALAVVRQICDALQFAHEEGIVHRDVKPENVLIDKRGRVRIADFGLAKLLGRSVNTAPLTISHQVMGTMHYMAPEQLENPTSVDHRADIYSLGVVFYELLTGELPLGRFAPPSERAPVDRGLDGVVLRALEKQVDRRYQQVSEVATDLNSVKSDEPTARPRPRDSRLRIPPPGARSWPVVTTLLCVATLGVLTVPWEVPSNSIPNLFDPQRWDTMYVALGSRTDEFISGEVLSLPSLGYFDSQLRIWPAQSYHGDPQFVAVIPNSFAAVMLFVIGGCAVARAATGWRWPVFLQFLLAGVGFAHAITLLLLMSQVLNIQLGPLWTVVAFGFLTLIPVAELAHWSTRSVFGQEAQVQLRWAGAIIMTMASLLCLFLLAALATVPRFDRDTVISMPVVFTSALALFSGFVAYGGWQMYTLQSYRLATMAAVFAQPVGMWALVLLARPEVKTAFNSRTRATAAQIPSRHASPRVPPAKAQRAASANRLEAPAIGLIVVGCLDLFIVVVPIAVSLVMRFVVGLGTVAYSALTPLPLGQSAVSNAPVLWLIMPLALVAMASLPVAGVLILGGLKMRRHELYSLAVFASIAAMLPCHAAFLVGLPVGLWSLMVLLQADSKALFQRQ